MTLNNYHTGEPTREATVEQAVRSMLAGPEGVINIDGQAYYYVGPREVWAVVTLGGPCLALGLTYYQASRQFDATRGDMGIAPNADLTGIRLLRITPESALDVIKGYPDEWKSEGDHE